MLHDLLKWYCCKSAFTPQGLCVPGLLNDGPLVGLG